MHAAQTRTQEIQPQEMEVVSAAKASKEGSVPSLVTAEGTPVSTTEGKKRVCHALTAAAWDAIWVPF